MKDKFDILVIDDEPVVLDSIAKSCSLENLKVDLTKDAKQALKRLDKYNYKLIITDIMMPEIDGFQFLEYIKNTQIETPVIVTTGYSTVENAIKSLTFGAIDFLPKPFTFEELISVTLRGLKYAELFLGIKLRDIDKNDLSGKIEFIAPPNHYLELGYLSWANIENNGCVKIGISDMFVKTISSIQKVELVNLDEEIVQGNACAHIITKEQMPHQILSPLTGRIININDSLLQKPDLIEKDPYFASWLYTIIPSDLEYEMERLKQNY